MNDTYDDVMSKLNTSPKETAYLDVLLKRGFAERRELVPFINHIIDNGYNNLGLRDITLILEDGSNWCYIAEDDLYELSDKRTRIL